MRRSGRGSGPFYLTQTQVLKRIRPQVFMVGNNIREDFVSTLFFKRNAAWKVAFLFEKNVDRWTL